MLIKLLSCPQSKDLFFHRVIFPPLHCEVWRGFLMRQKVNDILDYLIFDLS